MWGVLNCGDRKKPGLHSPSLNACTLVTHHTTHHHKWMHRSYKWHTELLYQLSDPWSVLLLNDLYGWESGMSGAVMMIKTCLGTINHLYVCVRLWIANCYCSAASGALPQVCYLTNRDSYMWINVNEIVLNHLDFNWIQNTSVLMHFYICQNIILLYEELQMCGTCVF